MGFPKKKPRERRETDLRKLGPALGEDRRRRLESAANKGDQAAANVRKVLDSLGLFGGEAIEAD